MNAESCMNNEFISLHQSLLGFYTTHNRQMSLLGQCLRGIVKPQFPSWLSAHFNPLQFCVNTHFLSEKEFTHGKLWVNTQRLHAEKLPPKSSSLSSGSKRKAEVDGKDVLKIRVRNLEGPSRISQHGFVFKNKQTIKLTKQSKTSLIVNGR